MYDDDDEPEGPKSSFTTYLSEGNVHFNQGEYKKALDSYTQALELQPGYKVCLVQRSKCYLRLGNADAALRDAEESLAEDKEYNKGLYQKAEALYSKGEFEYALLYYHRGYKLRQDQEEFKLGIQKAQEAIDNAIGSKARVKLENKGDLSFFAKQDEAKKTTKGYSKPTALAARNQQQAANRGKNTKSPVKSEKTVKKLLGELYADKKYLEKLMDDQDFIHGNSSKPIYDLVQDGLSYLDTRIEFWRQQEPLYARKNKKLPPRKSPQRQLPADTTKFILRSLEEIDQALADGDPETSLNKAQSTLKTVQSLGAESVPNKAEVVGNLYSCIGNAHLEMENYEEALKFHEKDLKAAKKMENKEAKSRALDNLGRLYAKMGEYTKAIDSWMEKLPLSKSVLESTWLYHEIGRCHLELKYYQDAKEFGQRSLAAAEQADDKVWQLNATVLAAQAEVKLGDLKDALQSFEKALDLAKILEDDAAENAISKAINDVNDRITQGVKSGEESAADEHEGAEESKETANEQNEETEAAKQTEEEEELVTEDSVKESHEEAKEDEAAEGNAKKDTEQEPDEANGATKDADQPAEDDGVKEQ
ncbi:outer dynein arm-docking complex subunit 4-like [Pocillopora verrucosa]|uniref:outer dynein arm-docking complex subunit 4-like n=1 Tax=Pocillopora verrucosa TaxID=203993 RepID=UPI0033424D66